MASSFKTLTERLAGISLQIAALQEQDKQLREELSKLHAKGKVPTKFEANGFNFCLNPGRTTWEYPDALKDRIKRMQAYAQKQGTATQKVGSPFWTLKAKTVKAAAVNA